MNQVHNKFRKALKKRNLFGEFSEKHRFIPCLTPSRAISSRAIRHCILINIGEIFIKPNPNVQLLIDIIYLRNSIGFSQFNTTSLNINHFLRAYAEECAETNENVIYNPIKYRFMYGVIFSIFALVLISIFTFYVFGVGIMVLTVSYFSILMYYFYKKYLKNLII